MLRAWKPGKQYTGDHQLVHKWNPALPSDSALRERRHRKYWFP